MRVEYFSFKKKKKKRKDSEIYFFCTFSEERIDVLQKLKG